MNHGGWMWWPGSYNCKCSGQLSFCCNPMVVVLKKEEPLSSWTSLPFIVTGMMLVVGSQQLWNAHIQSPEQKWILQGSVWVNSFSVVLNYDYYGSLELHTKCTWTQISLTWWISTGENQPSSSHKDVLPVKTSKKLQHCREVEKMSFLSVFSPRKSKQEKLLCMQVTTLAWKWVADQRQLLLCQKHLNWNVFLSFKPLSSCT